MGLKLKYKQLIPSMMVATSLILSACQESGQLASPRVAKAGSEADQAKVQGRAQLTDDQKANGLVKDPTQLEAYKSHLKSQFETLSLDSGNSWPLLFKLKNWIIYPLAQVKETSAAISASSAEATNAVAGTVARQGLLEVWIDKTTYQNMNSQDQSVVLLGELLKSLYSLKNLSDEELCKLVNEQYALPGFCDPKKEKEAGDEKESLRSGQLAVRKAAPAIKTQRKPLEQADHNRVNVVKNYMLEQGVAIKVADLLALMEKNGFDMRVFKVMAPYTSATVDTSASANTATEQKSKTEDMTAKKNSKIDAAMVDLLFTQVKAMSASSVVCLSLNTEEKAECALDVQRDQNILGFHVTGKTSNQDLLKETVSQSKEIPLGYLKDAMGAEILVLIPLAASKALESPVVGMKYRGNYLIASREALPDGSETLKIEGFVSVPGVIKEVRTDDAGKTVCAGARIDNSEENSTVLYVAGSDKYLDTVRVMKGINPYAACK